MGDARLGSMRSVGFLILLCQIQRFQLLWIPISLAVHLKIFNVSLSGLWICCDADVARGYKMLGCGMLVCSHYIVD